jgi:hypothetical protein
MQEARENSNIYVKITPQQLARKRFSFPFNLIFPKNKINNPQEIYSENVPVDCQMNSMKKIKRNARYTSKE